MKLKRLLSALLILLATNLSANYSKEAIRLFGSELVCDNVNLDEQLIMAKIEELVIRGKYSKINIATAESYVESNSELLEWYIKKHFYLPNAKKYSSIKYIEFGTRYIEEFSQNAFKGKFNNVSNFLVSNCEDDETNCGLNLIPNEKIESYIKGKNSDIINEYREKYDDLYLSIMTTYHERYLSKIVQYYQTQVELYRFNNAIYSHLEFILSNCLEKR